MIDDDVIDSLRSWEDVEFALRDNWREVRDRVSGLVLTTHVDELLVDEPPSTAAEPRRLLRELGFAAMDERCWSWTPPSPAAGELRPPPPAFTPRLRLAWPTTARDLAIDRARSAMAVRILRGAFAATPTDLEVSVVNDDEEWDDEDEDDDDLEPGLECAALEARCGPLRRRTT